MIRHVQTEHLFFKFQLLGFFKVQVWNQLTLTEPAFSFFHLAKQAHNTLIFFFATLQSRVNNRHE